MTGDACVTLCGEAECQQKINILDHAWFNTDAYIDNIDYNSIKRLIKDNTSPGQGKAVSIPGTGDSVAKDFSNQLFLILNSEHDRVSLFIKSRWYEINSRLGTRFLSD